MSLQDAYETVASRFQLSYSPNEINEGLKCYVIPYGHVGFALHMLFMLSSRIFASTLTDDDDDDITPATASVLRILLCYLYKLAVAIYTTTQCHSTYRLLAVWQLLSSIFYGLFGVVLLAEQFLLAVAMFLLLWVPGIVVGILGLIPLITNNLDSLRQVNRVFIGIFGVYAGVAALFLLLTFVTFITLALSSTKSAEEARMKEEAIIAEWKERDPSAINRLEEAGALRPANIRIDNRRPLKKAFFKLARLLGWRTTKTPRTPWGLAKKFLILLLSVLVLSLWVVYVLGVLYSDWVLGIVSDNLLGVGHTKKSRGLTAGWFIASLLIPL